MTDPQTIPSAVGAFVTRVRREHGLTLDQIAGAARSYGAGWSASSVRNIERGQASLTLPTLLLLALALGHLMGRPLKLSDLLGDSEVLALAADNQYPVDRSWIDSTLRGEEVTVGEGTQADALDAEHDDGVEEGLEDEVLRTLREMRGRKLTREQRHGHLDQLVEQAQMPPEPNRRLRDRRPAASLAEERAAKKLGISAAHLRQLAHDLWARPLEDESSRRAGPDSTPQARGRVTRVLVDEMRESLKERR